jgi:2-oxoglutarate ferredoxin oxidoreductase subunit beta
MTTKNPEYDFKWCPGCGDFGVRRSLEFAMVDHIQRTELAMENNVVVAGIGCSGNLVHLLQGSQPYGFHGIHGRTLPIAMGIKMARPELNVVIVAGDGDFLSIGAEHIGPQAARNLDVCAVIMDNGVYGLTKGQSSPTTKLGEITSSTPFGKLEAQTNPLELYLTLGVSFIASGFSGQPRPLASLIKQGMDHPGFAVVHVQSPCTTYNDIFEELKGDPKKGIEPALWSISDEHDSSDRASAYDLLQQGGLPVGIVYKEEDRPSFDQRVEQTWEKAQTKTVEELMKAFEF